MTGPWNELPVVLTDDELLIGDNQVMQSWERPIMAALSFIASKNGGDVLEIGFGMGISANYLTERPIRSYTAIEMHPVIAETARQWGSKQNVPVTVLEGEWQDVIRSVPDGSFDGILFDSYDPAAGFWDHAGRLLRPGGIYTQYTGEINSVSRDMQQSLFQWASDVNIKIIDGLDPPPSCKYFSGSRTVVIEAVKRRG